MDLEDQVGRNRPSARGIAAGRPIDDAHLGEGEAFVPIVLQEARTDARGLVEEELLAFAQAGPFAHLVVVDGDVADETHLGIEGQLLDPQQELDLALHSRDGHELGLDPRAEGVEHDLHAAPQLALAEQGLAADLSEGGGDLRAGGAFVPLDAHGPHARTRGLLGFSLRSARERRGGGPT